MQPFNLLALERRVFRAVATKRSLEGVWPLEGRQSHHISISNRCSSSSRERCLRNHSTSRPPRSSRVSADSSGRWIETATEAVDEAGRGRRRARAGYGKRGTPTYLSSAAASGRTLFHSLKGFSRWQAEERQGGRKGVQDLSKVSGLVTYY